MVLTSDETKRIENYIHANKKQVVVIQGLGFVGIAMLGAVSLAKNRSGEYKYALIGVDLPGEDNDEKIGKINRGECPIVSEDKSLQNAYRNGVARGNIMATTEGHAYERADIVVVDINLDINKKRLGRSPDYQLNFFSFKKAMKDLAERIKPDCLVVVETTLPPGTCSKIILPIFESVFKKRGLKDSAVQLVHSFERVMPGKNYLNSIISYYRVFSATNKTAAKRAREFFESFIDTKNFPLVELDSTSDSEMAKVLENTYRAANIALIQEWSEYAERAGVNLFKVIDAIRMRETHKNIMQPGFGVGGYCLPKDSLLADWAYTKLLKSRKHLTLSLKSIDINDLMPTHTFRLLKKHLKSLKNKRILILGVSYRNDIADTRFSPTQLFYHLCKRDGALVFLHDPLVDYWNELGVPIETDLKKCRFENIDAVVVTLAYPQYKTMPPDVFLRATGHPKLIIDANNVIRDDIAAFYREKGIRMVGVGKGHWNKRFGRTK